MARRNPFKRIQLVYQRSSLLLKLLILTTILVSAAALVALRMALVNYHQQSQVLQAQAVQLQQVAQLGTKASIRRIATEELGLMDPNALFFSPGE